MSLLVLHQAVLVDEDPATVYEDFTTYTEVDPSTRISVTSERAGFSNLTRNVTAYLYKDFGAGFFAGNVSVDFDVIATSASGGGPPFCEVVGFANQIGDATAANRTNAMGVFLYNGNAVYLREMDGGASYSQSAAISLNTTYYMRFVRDEGVGTYGTVYLFVATSDANRSSGTWLHSLSIALHSSMKDYRYFYPCASFNDLNIYTISGWSEKYLIS